MLSNHAIILPADFPKHLGKLGLLTPRDLSQGQRGRQKVTILCLGL